MPFLTWFVPAFQNFFLQAVLGFAGTLGFAMLFNVPRKALIASSLIGMAGHLLRVVLEENGTSEATAMFWGALLVGLVGAVPARRLKLPLILFAVTGIICLIPGISAYKVLVYFSRGNILGGLQSAVETGFGVGAIAAGIGTARIFTDREWGFEHPFNQSANCPTTNDLNRSRDRS